MIPKEIASQIVKSATADIVPIIEGYISLTSKGGYYVGACPFHKDGNTSFRVSSKEGFYYCQCPTCRKGGNVVNFVMEIGKVDYDYALGILGRRYGINVARWTDLMEFATCHFEDNLRQSDEGQAYGLTYLHSRGFSDETIAAFRLGYSLKSGTDLTFKAIDAGWDVKDLVAKSLAYESKNDFFKDRIMFPITDEMGKVIAFSGRVLNPETKGVVQKYKNSADSAYNKREALYGIFQARPEIIAKNKCYIVEGNTDVISMHQIGIANVVAICGTALTEQHIQLIKQFTSNITLLFDSDAAGNKASKESIAKALSEDMNVSILRLPEGEDPDSYARKRTAEEFTAYADSHETSFIRFTAENLATDNLDDPDNRITATQTIATLIALVERNTEKRIGYIRECARIMRLSEASISKKVEEEMQNAAEEREIVRERNIREQRAQQAQDQQPDDFFLSPNDMEVLQHTVGSPSKSARRVVKTEVPSEVEMREILRYLVTYTQSEIHVQDGEQITTMTVGDYILSMLEADGLEPEDETLLTILNEYRMATDRTSIDYRHFLAMPDPGVGRFVAEALGRPRLSKMHSKYSPVEEEKDSLDEFVPRAIQELQMRTVQKMIEDAMTEMNRLIAQNAPDEEVEAAMKSLHDLNQVKRELALQMGERAVIWMKY